MDVNRGMRTVDDLQKYLMRSREYEHHISNMFRTLYTKYIDDKPQVELLKAIMSNNIGTPITETIIMDKLRTTDTFVKRYNNIITNLWRIIKGCEMDDAMLNCFLERFKDNDYTIANLQQDIVNNSSAPNQSLTHPLEDIADVLGSGVQMDDYAKVLDIMRSPRLAAELFLASCDIANHPKIKTAVSVYPKFFARDITVVELLRIFPSLLATLNVEGLIRTEHAQYNTVYNAINHVYIKYTGAEIEHMAFINSHIAALDQTNDGLDEMVKSMALELTRGDKYKELVMSHVNTFVDQYAKGAKTQHNDITPEDHEHIFTIIRVSNIGCNDTELIRSIVADYFTNRNAYIQTVGNIYKENLGRDLETEEVQKYCCQYRDHKTDLTQVKMDVQSSFEYIGAMHEMVANLAKDLDVVDKYGKGKIYQLIEGLMRDNEDKSSVTLMAKAREVMQQA